MRTIEGIGDNLQTIFKQHKKRNTQKGIVRIMSNADMTADEKQKAMLQLPFATENETFRMFYADQAQKKQVQDSIDAKVRLRDAYYQQEQQQFRDQGLSREEIDQANRYKAGIVGRPSTAQGAKKYIPATKGGKKVMLVIDPVTSEQIGEIPVGDIEGKSLPDQLKHWTTELKKAAGQYFGIEGGNAEPLDPVMYEFANEMVKSLVAELRGGGPAAGQPGVDATAQPRPVGEADPYENVPEMHSMTDRVDPANYENVPEMHSMTDRVDQVTAPPFNRTLNRQAGIANEQQFASPDMDPQTIAEYSDKHQYDYAAAFKDGVNGPDASGHMPSKYKRKGHNRRVIDGLDTKTAKQADIISTYIAMARQELGDKATAEQIAKRAKEMAKSKGWGI
jgi:hypothetical protein